MKKVISKNKRRPHWSFEFIPILINREKDFEIAKCIVFSDSAIYKFDDEDQHDVNKLFGFSLGWHHKNSVRFGWRPNCDLSRIEIVGYEYINGLRLSTIPICEVDLNKVYKYRLTYNHQLERIEYWISDGDNQNATCHPVSIKRKYTLGYKLGLYFGGNKKAPHDIIIYENKCRCSFNW